jgi:hypothetical protein
VQVVEFQNANKVYEDEYDEPWFVAVPRRKPKTDDLPKGAPYGHRNEQEKQQRDIEGKQKSHHI